MLYASELTRTNGLLNSLVDDDLNDVANLVARLLATAVTDRLRKNLTRGYRRNEKSMSRVRGRIDMLRTESGRLLDRGEVYCRFDDHTANTPRNRLARTALERLARLVSHHDVAASCRALAGSLGQAGVSAVRPSRAELAAEQFGRNDASDRTMVSLAQLAFDMGLPTEEAGGHALLAPEREETWVRRLFEKAVLGFARVSLEPAGYTVRGGHHLRWQAAELSSGMQDILPAMITDIVLDGPGGRLVVDTKFTAILTERQRGGLSLKSGYIYQMYAYLRSQEGRESAWDDAGGMLLHPAVGEQVDEEMALQGHRMRFATVDLSRPPRDIGERLKLLLTDGRDL